MQTSEPKLFVWDERVVDGVEPGITFVHGSEQSLKDFCNSMDVVLLSPGVPVPDDPGINAKTFCELDLFTQLFKKKVIAITGSLGKTTTTAFTAHLFNLLSDGLPIASGGNIGLPMLDLVPEQDKISGAGLELSSFQLESASNFHPAASALLTLSPNHLERHGSMEEYFLAKSRVLDVVSTGRSFVPAEAAHMVEGLKNYENLQWQLVFMCDDNVRPPENSSWIAVRNGSVTLCERGGQPVRLCGVPEISGIFPRTVCAAVGLLWAIGEDVGKLTLEHFRSAVCATIEEVGEHRIEFVGTVRGVKIYNDSKSTVVEATTAALRRLSGRKVVLLVGGLGKGVDRSGKDAFWKSLGCVREVVAFGGEAHVFSESVQCATLEEAVESGFSLAFPGDVLLLSPSGASFDLFSNYKERGKRFKELVTKKLGERNGPRQCRKT